MNNHPRISIIIPCYNQEDFLPKAICSLQAQTIRDWECIIVDDGSTDNSFVIAQRFAIEDQRIKIIAKKNGGSASARNFGMAVAQGDYIQFLDADDWIANDKLERQWTYMSQHNLQVSFTSFTHCYLKNNILRIERTHNTIPRFSRMVLLTGWGSGYSIPLHAFIYSRLFLQEHQILFDTNIKEREDWGFHLSVTKHTTAIDYLPTSSPAAYYYHNISSKTANIDQIITGNFRFIMYVFHTLKWYERIVWDYRLSKEIWFLIGRITKYKRIRYLQQVFPIVRTTRNNMLRFLTAILLLPISFIGIVVYYVKAYLLNKPMYEETDINSVC